MRFKIDENLPVELSELVQRRDHGARTVNDQKMMGASDLNLAKACMTEGRILVTLDTDFADMRKFPPGQHSGIVVLRLGSQSATHVLTVFRRVLEVLDGKDLAGRLWVVEETRIRIR